MREQTFNEALFRLAAKYDKAVDFGYAKGQQKVIENRRLFPADVREVGDHVTVVGYDPFRDEPRAYRLDRVKGEVKIA